MTTIFTGRNATPFIIKDQKTSSDLAWSVRWREGGVQREKSTNDAGFRPLCVWAAERADNATLIVTPLP